MKPQRFTHHCLKCVYLGQHRNYDLYHCDYGYKQHYGPVARNGPLPQDHSSPMSPVIGAAQGALAEALIRYNQLTKQTSPDLKVTPKE